MAAIADGAEVVEEDFSDAVLPVQRWKRRSFLRCSFRHAELSGLVTRGATFTDCDFTGADLGDSEHRGSALRTCTLRRATLAGSTWHSCTLLGSVFTESRLRPWIVRECDLALVGTGRHGRESALERIATSS